MNGPSAIPTLTPTEIVHREQCDELCRTIVESVRTVRSSVPPSDQYEYYGAFPRYQSVIHKLNGNIYNIMNDILASQKMSTSFHQEANANSRIDFTDKFDMLVEANDVILEKVGNLLDEVVGLRSAQPIIKVSDNAPAVMAKWNKNQVQSAPKTGKMFSCLNYLPKPQNDFEVKPDNSTLPFTPFLCEKPNSIKPLSASYCSFVDGKFSGETETVHQQPLLHRNYTFSEDFVDLITAHQYEKELSNFIPCQLHLQPVVCQKPAEVSSDNLFFIDTVPAFNALIDELSTQCEIAVDCEAHSHRSFLGFVCLLQLSTRAADYIVDTLALRSHIQKLNVIFTDPNILKVMHGCDSDVLWFQRDFGLYLVNVFDTGQAARVLNYPTFALSYLLKRYVDFDAHKEYQLADWRQRPLPGEMIEYARMDTHALLYIADNMRNALYERKDQSLFEVFNRSRLLCLKKYNKPQYDSNSYRKVLKNVRKRLTKQQEFVISKLYDWREETARMLDESPHYVLPNHMLIRIAEVLPREAQGILACCNPVPTLVREYLTVLHKIVLEAKAKVFSDATSSEISHPKYQNISHNVSLTQNSYPHDASFDASHDVVKVTVTSFNDLCLSEPRISLFTNIPNSNKSCPKALLDLEHPLSKYLSQVDTVSKFMTGKERSADALHLKMNQKLGESSKITHRWRISIQKQPDPITIMHSNPAPVLATAESLEQEPVEVPIVFDEEAIKTGHKKLLATKADLKKANKRKRREKEQTAESEENFSAKKAKKMNGKEQKESDEVTTEMSVLSDAEEMEHPTLMPSKKTKKDKKKKNAAGYSSSLLPNIRALTNKTFSFKSSK